MPRLRKDRADAEEAEAQRYAEYILDESTVPGGWGELNRAIVERWSFTALIRVKERAWKIVGERNVR